MKNSKRYLFFDDNCLYRSPDKPADCPEGGAGHCYYNIVRDANLQSYHQYVFADVTFPPAAWQAQ